MTLLIQYTIIFASVLLLVALGGCFSERSGVINIGLEGIMVIGALGGALVMKFLPVSVGAPVMVLTVILASAAAGLLYSLLLAVASITFRADQTITGTAMNLLATAAATVAVKAMNASMSGGNDVSSDISYIEPKKLFILNIGKFEFNWFMLVAVIALIVSFAVLYKTRFGLVDMDDQNDHRKHGLRRHQRLQDALCRCHDLRRARRPRRHRFHHGRRQCLEV